MRARLDPGVVAARGLRSVISSRSSVGTRRAFSQSRRVTRIRLASSESYGSDSSSGRSRVEQPADLVVGEPLVRDAAERRRAAAARASVPRGGIVTRWSQPSTPAARLRSDTSASRVRRSSRGASTGQTLPPEARPLGRIAACPTS